MEIRNHSACHANSLQSSVLNKVRDRPIMLPEKFEQSATIHRPDLTAQVTYGTVFIQIVEVA